MISVANRWQSEIRNPPDGTQPTNAGFGTLITADSTPHTKGAWTDIVLAADWSGFTGDAFEVEINFNDVATSATIIQVLADIGIDSGGGYVSIIDNLSACSAAPHGGSGRGITYKFPFRIENGVKVGCRSQSNVASQTVRAEIILRGNPSNAGLVRAGTFVRTLGANTGTSQGTAFTAGSASEGAWFAVATTADDLWYWEAGETLNDTATNSWPMSLDLGVGGVGVETAFARGFNFSRTTTEGIGKLPGGVVYPLPSGSDISIRGQAQGGEVGQAGIVYAVGGSYELPDAANATGTVTIGGSPAADGKTVEIYARDADGVIELIGSTTTGGGTGAFSLGVPDTTRSYFARYEDGTDVGCSLEGTPGSDDLDIAIGGGSTPIPTISGPRIIQDNVLRKHGA